MHRFLKPFKGQASTAAPDSASSGIDPPTPGMATPGVGSSHGHSSFIGGVGAPPMREASDGDMYQGSLPSSSSSSEVLSPSGSFPASMSASALQRQTAYEIMAETLYRYAQRERLFSDNPAVWNGVALRLHKGQYACSPQPQHDGRLAPWVAGLQMLNCDVSARP